MPIHQGSAYTRDIEKLVADHSVLQDENAALRSQVATLEEELALAQEQITWLKSRSSDAKQN